MNIRHLLAGTAVAALGLFGGVANASDDGVIKSANFLGPTGYIMTPNAYVQPNTSFSIGTHFVVGPSGLRVGLPDTQVVHGTLGLFDWAEIGGAYRIVYDNPVPNAAYMNAKVRLSPSDFPLQIAGGVQDGTNSLARNLYAVATLDVMKALGHCSKKGGTITSVQVGGGYRWQSDEGGFPVPAINAPFANGAIQIGRNVQLMGEWNPDQEFFFNAFYPLVGTVNAGLRVSIPALKGLTLDIAGIGLDDEARTYGGGLNYTMQFGHSHSKKECAAPAAEQTASNDGLRVFANRPAVSGLVAHLAR